MRSRLCQWDKTYTLIARKGLVEVVPVSRPAQSIDGPVGFVALFADEPDVLRLTNTSFAFLSQICYLISWYTSRYKNICSNHRAESNCGALPTRRKSASLSRPSISRTPHKKCSLFEQRAFSKNIQKNAVQDYIFFLVTGLASTFLGAALAGFAAGLASRRTA